MELHSRDIARQRAAEAPHGSSTMPSSTDIQAMIQKSMASRLPQAVHDATGELVERIVDAQLMQEMMPVLQRLSPSILQKAQPQRGGQLSQVEEPQGLLYDPFTALDQMGFRERPSAITFRTLGDMARRVPPFTAYLVTRLSQLGAFCEPQPDEHSVGFKYTLRDKQKAMSRGLQKRADYLTRWTVACGDPDLKVKRDKFGAWMKKFMWDSLVYDQGCCEVVPWKGTDEPAYLRVLDGATIRISDTLDEVDLIDDSIQYVQIYDDTIIGEFTEDMLMFGVRNPRSDIRYSGYGFPELEMLVSIVTALLWGIDYNAKFFSQGSVAKGVLNFKGAVPERELQSFRRQWYSMITGVTNAWRTPVVNADDVQWLDMHQSNRDMEFANWIDWLLKVVCAVCLIAPEEIGFQFGNSGQSSTMNEGSQVDKLAQSKDKGLIPLAKFVAEQWNEKVVSKLDDRFELQFAGINARTAEGLIALQEKEVKTVKTIDEVRKERGDNPLPDGLGELILDPTFFQAWQFKQQAKQQGQGGDGYGAPPGTPDVDSQPIHGSEDDDSGGGDDSNETPNKAGKAPPNQDTDGDDAEKSLRRRRRPGKRPSPFGLSKSQAAALSFDVEV